MSSQKYGKGNIKFVKVPSGTKVKKIKKRKSKGKDALTGKKLHGVIAGKRKKKTTKRPSALFGGILTGESRKLVQEEAAKVRVKIKKIEDVDLRLKQYVEIAVKKGEKHGGN